MNTLSYLVLLTSVCYLAILIILLANWKKTRAYTFYTFFIITGLVWVSVGVLEVSAAAKNLEINEILSKIDFIFAALMSYSVALFALHFPSKNIKISLIKEIGLLVPIIFIICLVLFEKVFTQKTVEPHYNLFWYFVYFTIIATYYIGIAFTSFLIKKKHVTGIVKTQLNYLTYSYILTVAIGLSFSVFFAFNTHFSPWFGLANILTLIFAFGSSYVMFRYRFMDIRVVINKGMIYIISLAMALVFYTFIVLSLRSTIEESWNNSVGWTAAVLILITVAGFIPVKKGVENVINKLFKGQKSIDLAVKELKEDISEQSDASGLARLVTAQTRRFLDVGDAHLYLGKPGEEIISYGNGGNRMDQNNVLIQYFQKYREPIVREEIEHIIEDREGKFEKDILQKVDSEMKKQKLAIVLPFVHEDGVFGLLTVGERESKEAFTVQDIQFLTKLREEISFTLASALQYFYAMERIQRMQKAGEM